MKELRSEFVWFTRLQFVHKVYIMYWIFSFVLMFGVNENTSIVTLALTLANFANSTRLLRKVDIDEVEN